MFVLFQAERNSDLEKLVQASKELGIDEVVLSRLQVVLPAKLFVMPKNASQLANLFKNLSQDRFANDEDQRQKAVEVAKKLGIPEN